MSLSLNSRISFCALLIFSLFGYSCSSDPKFVERNNCLIISVEKGLVIDPIISTGMVEPESEFLLRCPYSTTVKKIIKEPGSTVQRGDLILVLDDSQINSEIDNIKDQLELKRNNLKKNNLAETSTKIDLKYTEEVKKLNINSLKSQLSDEEQLLEVGGISPAKIEKTKQEIALAEKELLTLKEKNSIRLKQLSAEEEGLLLGIEIQEKELKEKLTYLELMNVKSPSEGIVLMLGCKLGEKVSKDQTLARLSDLSSFKISGSADEKFAKYLKTGAFVFAMLDNVKLVGRIGIVSPIVENGKIQFNVHLDESSHPKLIAHQNMDLLIAKDYKDSTLRIKNLPQFEKGDLKYLYVIKGNQAFRHPIKVGYKSPDFLEILSGISEGDQIIVPLAGYHSLGSSSEVIVKN